MFLNKKNPYLLYIGIFLLFIPLTYLYPRLNSDDYGYAFNWSNESEYLETPGDFIESNIAHYMNRNGRIWANGIAAIFSANDFDIIFKILNAVFFVLLIFFTIKVAEKDERITNVKIICLFMLTWFFDSRSRTDLVMDVWRFKLFMGRRIYNGILVYAKTIYLQKN